MAPLLRVRHAREAAKRARVMAELEREPDDRRVVGGVTPAGDERRLRGIPVQARGVAGAIPGTRP